MYNNHKSICIGVIQLTNGHKNINEMRRKTQIIQDPYFPLIVYFGHMNLDVDTLSRNFFLEIVVLNTWNHTSVRYLYTSLSNIVINHLSRSTLFWCRNKRLVQHQYLICWGKEQKHKLGQFRQHSRQNTAIIDIQLVLCEMLQLLGKNNLGGKNLKNSNCKPLSRSIFIFIQKY